METGVSILGPINAGIRFLLEIAALAALAYWGWTSHEGSGSVVWSVGLVLVASVVWGTFRVPGNPGAAPVPVPGGVRLLLELVLFGAAFVLLAVAGRPWISLGLGAVTTLHYLASLNRIAWLLSQR
jgi:hypothetical protein